MNYKVNQELEIVCFHKAPALENHYESPPSETPKSPLILITDNDNVTRTALRQAMEADGYRVIEASHGKECIEAYLGRQPDLIVLDAMMLVMDGLTCSPLLHNHNQQPFNSHSFSVPSESIGQAASGGEVGHTQRSPILVVMTQDDPDMVERAFASGADDCITKPINLTILRRRVHHLLQNRQLQQSLKSLQTHTEALERRNQDKEDFLNTVAHELRSPLSNMRMAIQMLQQSLLRGRMECGAAAEVNQDCTKALTYLQILSVECEREITLVNDLLDLQRLEAQRQPLNLSSVPLKDWILDEIKPFKQRAEERQQIFQIDLQDDLPNVVTDSASLERIVIELLTNACKYTPPHETITLTIFTVDQDKLQLKLSNSGVEIPASEFSRIFDKFYRIHKSDRWKQGGTGLGLALVKGLVAHISGSINVESADNLTCFTVELPLNSPPT